nr:MAG TPA: hypothetical protein [Caudoviricetes sp.]
MNRQTESLSSESRRLCADKTWLVLRVRPRC